MRNYFGLLLLIMVAAPFSLPVPAQEETGAIQSLAVELWPDYDRPAVLVLLTGALPADTPLPAPVTLPLPEGADINAVARLGNDNNLFEIAHTADSGQLTFTTPDRRFRVEYYLPYMDSGNQRTFTYTWQAGFPVAELTLTVQEPAAASSLIIEPPAVASDSGFNDLTYHTLPVQNVPAGQPFTVRIDYVLTSPQLSIEQGPSAAVVGDSGTAVTASTNINWALVAAAVGGLLVVIALTWQVASSRAETRPRKPRPVRSERQVRARFCHACGRAVQPGDRFCRQCGTAIKGA